MNRFTTEFYDNFRIKKSTKPSDIKVRMIIGKQNNIQHAEISGFKDEKMKSEIKRVLKLPNLNKWHSANTILGKSDYEIIFLIKIK
ncbi:hypothetical protein OA84_07580 [Kaistella solincola]|uniref:TonB C-terminal domain-containing protein n=2 Tax=Kaistella solincola TaxID=510955 RepID=A0ABR4ZPU4_9FLAO|nr:hypothetical protein OA84_07580 [Kaistella solincola]